MYWNKTFKKACPCKGDITWTAWDDDCRGNDGGYKIDCNKCERTFTPDEARKLTKGMK